MAFRLLLLNYIPLRPTNDLSKLSAAPLKGKYRIQKSVKSGLSLQDVPGIPSVFTWANLGWCRLWKLEFFGWDGAKFVETSVEIVDIPLHVKSFSHLKIAYLGTVAVASALVTVGEIILKDVWSGFSFSGEALPTLEVLALVKSNSSLSFLSQRNTNKFLLISREFFGGSFGRNVTETIRCTFSYGKCALVSPISLSHSWPVTCLRVILQQFRRWHNYMRRCTLWNPWGTLWEFQNSCSTGHISTDDLIQTHWYNERSLALSSCLSLLLVHCFLEYWGGKGPEFSSSERGSKPRANENAKPNRDWQLITLRAAVCVCVCV